MISKLFPAGIPVKAPTAVSTIFAPFCPKDTTLQLKTLLEQLTLTDGTPTSVKIRLVHLTPEAFRKCNAPVPLAGVVKEKVSPKTGMQLPLGQPTGSRIMTPGSMLSAWAAPAEST